MHLGVRCPLSVSGVLPLIAWLQAERLILMSMSATLNNGAYFHLGAWQRSILAEMYEEHYFDIGSAPFYYEEGDGTRYIESAFSLTKAEMAVFATRMFQRLFPNLSWRRTWKRTDGQHTAWVTTKHIVDLVTFDQRYQQLQAGLLAGHIAVSEVAQFDYFRRMLGEDGLGAIHSTDVSEWLSNVFLTMELMRELDGCPSQDYFFA